MIYHVRGTLESCSVATKPAEALKGDGYPMLKNLQKGNAEKACEVSFKLRDAAGQLILRCEGERAVRGVHGDLPG